MKKSFKAFLMEKAMNMSVYKDVLKRLENDAKIGFEFEFLVSEDQLQSDRPYDELSRYDISDLTALKDYFDIDRNTIRQIDAAYESWFEAEQERWIEDNYSDFEDSDEENARIRYQDAKIEARSKFEIANTKDRGDFTYGDWYKRNFKDLKELFDEFNILPIYGWKNQRWGDFFTADGESSDDAKEYVAAIMTNKMTETTVGHPGAGGYNTWGVIDDGSVLQDGFVGVEVVSPPMKPSKALEMLDEMFYIMHKQNFKTNQTCGLHVGISIPNITQKLDPLKLVLFLDENYVLSMFNRKGNTFTLPLVAEILKYVRNHGDLDNDPSKFVRKFSYHLLKNVDRRTAANLSNLISKGYVEFRAAGGEDYHHRKSEVIETIGRYVAAIEIATNPESEKKEYLKKVSKLINALQDKAGTTDYDLLTGQDDELNVMKVLGRVVATKDTKALVKQQAEKLTSYTDGSDPAQAVKIMASMLRYVYRSARKLNMSLTTKEIVFIKKLMKALRIDISMLSDEFDAQFKIYEISDEEWPNDFHKIKRDLRL